MIVRSTGCVLLLIFPAILLGDTYCQGLSGLLRASLASLPTEQAIPCDPAHVVEVSDMTIFLKEYFQRNPRKRDSIYRSRFETELIDSYAFVLDLHFPIYVNVGRLAAESRGFNEGATWLAYALAPLLIHERAHATGEVRESVAHRAELELAERFLRQNLIPADGYDLRGLRQAIKEAEQRESHR